jgi:hypothetical protein
MGVYLYPNNTETELKNAYIWEYQERWQPWANTVAYFPFSSDAIDVTGNNTLTNSWTQNWLWWEFSSWSNITTPSGIINYVNFWIQINNYWSTNNWICLYNKRWIGYYAYQGYAHLNKKIFIWYDSNFSQEAVDFAPTTWTRHNISYGYDWTKTIYSIDGVSWTLYNWVGYDFGDSFIVAQKWWVVISKLILEDICWTSEQIANYYNQTKSNYWL